MQKPTMNERIDSLIGGVVTRQCNGRDDAEDRLPPNRVLVIGAWSLVTILTCDEVTEGTST